MSDLEELRARKREKDAARQAAKDARELETLTLEETLEKSLGGPRGRAFEIVDVAGGPLIAVKPGAAVLFKQFRDSKMSLDDMHMFIVPNLVQPDAKGFAACIERNGAVIVRVFDALVALYRGEEAEEGKKY